MSQSLLEALDRLATIIHRRRAREILGTVAQPQSVPIKKGRDISGMWWTKTP